MGRRDWRRNQAWMWVWISALGFCFPGYGGFEAQAGPLYVYTDAQGQAVLTDNLDQVPAAYRGRVRTMTGTDSPAPAPIPTPALTGNKTSTSSGVIGDILSAVAAKVASRTIKGLTAYQTAVVIVAGMASLTLLLFIFLSANPAIRILCKVLLVVVGVSALYQVVAIEAPSLEALAGPSQQGTSQPVDNMLGRMRSQTEQSYRAQDERTTRQLEPAGQPTP